jgi:hypothetical protein
MNAKEELSSKIQGLIVKCAFVQYGDTMYYDEDDAPAVYLLKLGYSEEEFNAFINSLDFDYNNGYGGQNLFGDVWFTDGTWLERGEYDGSEWWEHKICPEIPESLL